MRLVGQVLYYQFTANLPLCYQFTSSLLAFLVQKYKY
jgi:hypothetical protein